MRLVAIASALLLTVAAAPVSAQVNIDFEGTGAPCFFSNTTPLTTAYSGIGVTFSGTGSILNECGNFPTALARSGTDFLAYNVSFGTAGDVIVFSSAQSYFEIYAGSASAISAEWFLAGNSVGLLGTNIGPNAWNLISFSGAYDQVTITSDSNLLTLDDLSTGAVVATPEPASLVLLATGLLGVGVISRRRKIA